MPHTAAMKYQAGNTCMTGEFFHFECNSNQVLINNGKYVEVPDANQRRDDATHRYPMKTIERQRIRWWNPSNDELNRGVQEWVARGETVTEAWQNLYAAIKRHPKNPHILGQLQSYTPDTVLVRHIWFRCGTDYRGMMSGEWEFPEFREIIRNDPDNIPLGVHKNFNSGAYLDGYLVVIKLPVRKD